jgi:ABC-type transporter Mla subunit MlaD
MNVWKSVCELLEDPDRLMREWSRRASSDGVARQLRDQQEDAARLLTSLNRSLQRLLDAYEAGAIELEDLESRSDALRRRIKGVEHDLEEATKGLNETTRLREVVTRLADFGAQVRGKLETLAWGAAEAPAAHPHVGGQGPDRSGRSNRRVQAARPDLHGLAASAATRRPSRHAGSHTGSVLCTEKALG